MKIILTLIAIFLCFDSLKSEKVSVIIPTYNRFIFLSQAIKSVVNQSYEDIEIIIVNDCSSEKVYYTYDFSSFLKSQSHLQRSIKVINLQQNSKELFGYACAAYVRNSGINIATGKYIAFLDDDDMWFPTKIEKQIAAMKKTKCKMSSTEGIIGKGLFDAYNYNSYKAYNSEHYYETLKYIYRSNGSNILDNGFPDIWNLDFIKIHNCIICSSVLMERDLVEKIGMMKEVRNGEEDYDYWLRALDYTDCAYVKDKLFYYDVGHGYGHR